MKKLNKVKSHSLGFTLNEDGLVSIGIVTFEDNTCKPILIVDNPVFGETYLVRNRFFEEMRDLYKYISNKASDYYYEEIEVEGE